MCWLASTALKTDHGSLRKSTYRRNNLFHLHKIFPRKRRIRKQMAFKVIRIKTTIKETIIIGT